MPFPNKPHIKTLVAFIAAQMGGEQVPPEDSDELARLGEAVEAIQAQGKPSNEDLQILAHLVLSAVIDHVRSGLACERAMRGFIQPPGAL